MDIGVIYQNNNVYISHIDTLSSEYNLEVTGVLTLVEHTIRHPGRKNVIERLITWKPIVNDNESIPNCVNAIQIDIDELKSFKRAKMTMGNCHSYMVFSSRDGQSSPMLIFRDGGTRNLVDKLENYLSITKSTKERFLFLVEPRREDAVYKSFESLGMFSQTKEAQASKFSRPSMQAAQKQSPLWSGIVSIGAHITSQLTRNLALDPDASYIRDLLREDAFGLPMDTHRLNTSEDNETGFEIVSKLRIKLPTRSPVQRRAPLTEIEWKKHLSPDGTVTCVPQLMEKIFKGGIEMSLRPTVWKYLLKYHQWHLSADQNQSAIESFREQYNKLKIQWQNIFPEQEVKFSTFRERKSIIEKDMHRTDRTIDFYNDENGSLRLIYNILLSYSMYNFDLGYVQGMNDLLAPILYLVHDEIDAFGCFVNLMNTLESNFSEEQLGIKKQFRQLYTLLQIFDCEFAEYLDAKGCRDMLFCFRWLLVNFKRELSYENTMLLWEILWTNYRCNNFHLLFALAVLLGEKNRIIENRFGFNEILKHVNDLRLNEDVQMYLCHAESIYLQLEQIWPEIPEEMRDILDMRISCCINKPSPPQSNHSSRISQASSDQQASSKNNFVSLMEVPSIDDTIIH